MTDNLKQILDIRLYFILILVSTSVTSCCFHFVTTVTSHVLPCTLNQVPKRHTDTSRTQNVQQSGCTRTYVHTHYIYKEIKLKKSRFKEIRPIKLACFFVNTVFRCSYLLTKQATSQPTSKPTNSGNRALLEKLLVA